MYTALVIEPTTIDRETEGVLADPEARASLEALADPEDREDLLDALVIRKRIAEGEEKSYSVEEVRERPGM